MGYWPSLVVSTICVPIAVLIYFCYVGPPPSHPSRQHTHRPPYFPVEVAKPPGENPSLYTHFFEKADCVLHRDGASVIILKWRPPPGVIEDTRDLDGWATINMRKVYEHLHGAVHPRIVRYTGALSDGSLVVEKLCPGPTASPDLELPAHVDGLTRASYYRWSLQALSALCFLHAHGVLVKSFCWTNIWLRADFSLALTGFVAALIEGRHHEQMDYGESAGLAGEEYHFDYNEELIGNSIHKRGIVEEDLFFWARWSWCLLNPGSEVEWITPHKTRDPRYRPDTWAVDDEGLRRELFGGMGEASLGPVLAKAWDGEYDDAREVLEEARICAARAGLKVVGEDEIDIGQPWEQIFEIVESEEEYGDQSHSRSLRVKA